MKRDQLEGIIENMVDDGRIIAARTRDGEIVVDVKDSDDKRWSYDLYDRTLIGKIRHEIYRLYGESISTKMSDIVTDKLELIAYDNYIDKSLCKRVYNDGNDTIIYDLSVDTYVVIQPDDVCIEPASDVLFKRTPTYLPQVVPDLDIEADELIPLLEKHFNLANESQLKLLAIYLVSCFYGLNIATPIAVCVGEKGSSKSSMLKKLCALIDPKSNSLCGMQGDLHNLQLRMGSDYFLALDNLNRINRNTSDMLSISSTGGSVSKRRLHTDQDQVYINLRCLCAINSVSMVAKESDLLDRSIIFQLLRIPPNKIKTEKEVWDSFNEDLPCILGACFNALALALACDYENEHRKLIRLADFHLLAYKIGYAIGLEDDEVDEVIWDNQRRVNQEVLDSDEVGSCIVELMSSREEPYVGAMHELLRDIKNIATRKEISLNLIPASPNHLSSRLSKIKENLRQAYKITYNIKNIGPCKQITIVKK